MNEKDSDSAKELLNADYVRAGDFVLSMEEREAYQSMFVSYLETFINMAKKNVLEGKHADKATTYSTHDAFMEDVFGLTEAIVNSEKALSEMATVAETYKKLIK